MILDFRRKRNLQQPFIVPVAGFVMVLGIVAVGTWSTPASARSKPRAPRRHRQGPPLPPTAAELALTQGRPPPASSAAAPTSASPASCSSAPPPASSSSSSRSPSSSSSAKSLAEPPAASSPSASALASSSTPASSPARSTRPPCPQPPPAPSAPNAIATKSPSDPHPMGFRLCLCLGRGRGLFHAVILTLERSEGEGPLYLRLLFLFWLSSAGICFFPCLRLRLLEASTHFPGAIACSYTRSNGSGEILTFPR